jgi:lysine 2,3-aminomutase
MGVKYITDISKIQNIPEDVREQLKQVAKKFVFRVNDYYIQLINWEDPNDPIRQLIVPHPDELKPWGRLDASNEISNTPVRGVQHKYPHTVLLLCNEVCGAYCRYCFRKRLFMNDNDEVSFDIGVGLEYIRTHKQVTNVLLTGGDPLILGTRRLKQIFEQLRAIEHVQIIRIGTKMPAFNPWRVIDDPELQASIREHSTAEKRIYIMAHFDHPRELTESAIKGIDCLQRSGAIVVNQCPLLRGINDNSEILAEMFRKLSFIGAPQYYLFQGRPTEGNLPYTVPIVRGYTLFEDAKKQVSGLAKRARFVMSHETGKIEIVGVDERHMYLRYHRAKDPADEGRFMIFERDDDALWLDDLKPVDFSHRIAPLAASTTMAQHAVEVEHPREQMVHAGDDLGSE